MARTIPIEQQVSHHFREGLSDSSPTKPDAILGLCWLRRNQNRFIAGSARGKITLCDISEPLATAAEGGAGTTASGRSSSVSIGVSSSGSSISSSSSSGGGGDSSSSNGGGPPRSMTARTLLSKWSPLRAGTQGASPGAPSSAEEEEPPPAPLLLPPGVVAAYPDFEKLTSVHVDAVDSQMLACGYSLGVKLYDLETTKVNNNLGRTRR